ncbi:hypothetical protein DITRI_Ditri12bG0068600 [Diplodiscus trichospermus]
MDIDQGISKSLAANALISSVNGALWDMNRPLEGDCELKIFTFDSDEGRDTFCHSSAHILGQSLESIYGCKLCIGPCTTRGEGFYYDAFYGDLGLNEDHVKQIEAGALKAFAVTSYMTSKLSFEDMWIPVTTISWFTHEFLSQASSAYWRGNKDRESLQRVYGISYPDQKCLKEYIHQLEEAKKYNYRLLGAKQELFFCHPLSPGSWFFLPHGTRIYNKLMEFIRNEYWKRGYQKVKSPNMYNMNLWETSGHAANYKENMFLFEIEKQRFGLKPMNCPGHCLMFQHKVRSYKELPLRLADFGVLHRNEASGALTGLIVLGGFNRAEAVLTEALNLSGKPWQINEGDGAFYGPKIDISVSGALNRKFQCATLQLDFQLPGRFKLEYSAEDEAKREKPVMIHRAILGSVEQKSQKYAIEVRNHIHEAGYYVDVDLTDRKSQKKVREAQLAQYNYILVVGEEELNMKQVSLRVRDRADHSTMSLEGLLHHFKAETTAFIRMLDLLGVGAAASGVVTGFASVIHVRAK